MNLISAYRINPGDDMTSPDLVSVEDSLPTSNTKSSEPQPPVVNDGVGAVTGKVDAEAHANEVNI